MADDRNIFITSNNQMGGVTAHTVNVGAPARTMNEELGNQLKQKIPTSASVTVSASMNDSESFEFANQVLTWLKGNGYDNVHGVNGKMWMPPIKGHGLSKKNKNEFEIAIGTRA